MNRKVLVTFVVLMAAAMLATPLVSAAPLKEKNNEKFQTFHVTFTTTLAMFFFGTHEYIPSMDKVNLLIIENDESFISYDITVGSKTYHLGSDFKYTGHFKFTFYDVTAWLVIPGVVGPYVFPSEDRGSHLIVNYMYEFLPASGIVGTIQLRAEANNRGWMTISSLAGTGDLRNVQIKAVQSGETDTPPTATITHDGMVFGWPE